jgi:hypothetical protein
VIASVFADERFPSPRAAVERVGEFHLSEMSRGGGRAKQSPPLLTPPHHALRAWAGGEARDPDDPIDCLLGCAIGDARGLTPRLARR